jgi:hypothetical protein
MELLLQGISLNQIARQHLLGYEQHPKSFRSVGIGWRRVQAEYLGALQDLKKSVSHRAA